ncbi:glycoside hydrolase [Daedaleopsis nitida]|nr:glycoside hydrolase [Daedaleopsis nitida]
MRKLMNKIKTQVDETIESVTRSDSPPMVKQPDALSDRLTDESDMYRYRKMRGVNLGSWFVLERWIADSPFRCARAPAHSDWDVAMGSAARNILEQHWDTWITEQDWVWLSEKGVNTVRIPIGFYHICGADSSVLRGTDFSELGGVFEGAWDRITNALASAHRHGVGVLFDLHAAPGKQNADSHSGTSSEPTFFENSKNMRHTLNILTIFVTHIKTFARSHNPPLPNLVGIELLNEPAPGSHSRALKEWYKDAFRAVRAIDPNLPIYIGDSWSTDEYTAFIKASETPSIVLDHHLYRCFTSGDIATPASEHARRLRESQEATPELFSRVSKELEGCGGALVVGEWSAALNPGSLHGASDEHTEKRQYVQAQLQLYEQHCAGWFFWTYKKEHGGDTGWSFRDAVEAGVFPVGFARLPRGAFSEDDMGSVRERTRDDALGHHKAYWDQYPGRYEHQRFYDGFTTGWNDAISFASWRSAATGPWLEELGFTGPWMKRRAQEHVHRTGGASSWEHVWEFEHGFLQGRKSAHDYVVQ